MAGKAGRPAIWREAPMSVPSLATSGIGPLRLGSAVVQMPEKSGWPSASRGAGACMSTVPSALRGTPAVVWFSH